MFSAKEKAGAAEREVRQRQRVYPRWVADGRMTQEFADRQIAIMREIAADYLAQAEAEERQGRLF